MDNASKGFKLILILIIAISSLSPIVIKPTSAQSIPMPSVPEFTLKLADHSYDVPPIPPVSPTYTTDPYSGKQVILNPGSSSTPGYHVQNFTIDITIVNQPYPRIINGNASFVYYDVRIKGHFGQDWTELFQYYSNSPVQSNSQKTVISLPDNYQVGDQIDIQVQAAIGYKIVTYIGHPPMNVYTESVDFQHSSSDWSQTQTITIPESNTSPTLNPTPTPTVPEFPILTIALLFVILISASLSLYFKKYNQEKCEQV